MWRGIMIDESNDAEENGQDDKATHLNGFAANSVDGSHADPITRNNASNRNNQVSDRDIVQAVVDVY
jgi:hypothetical protein